MREKQFANEKSNLTKIRGFEPSDNDVQWNLLNKEIIRHVTQQDWGFFRNTKFAMAEILRKESKLMAALGFYLEVCYIDLNGPNNLGGVSDSRLIREFPAWNPKLNAFLAPGVITRISKIIRKTESSEATVQKIFFQDAEKLKDSFHMPVPVGIAWVETKKALIENKAFY
jgi:hypothetical protein